MPAPELPTRRFTFALTAAVAATTIAVGVTAATLLGWVRPAPSAPTAPTQAAGASVVYVPIAPSAPPDPAVESTTPTRIAMDEPRERESEREHEREDDDE